MTELEVKENRFYVLRIREESVERITLHSEISSSVERVREALKNGTSPENIELMSFDVKEEKFEIKGVPWSTIAAELVK
jgi:hypothetical protein